METVHAMALNEAHEVLAPDYATDASDNALREEVAAWLRHVSALNGFGAPEIAESINLDQFVTGTNI